MGISMEIIAEQIDIDEIDSINEELAQKLFDAGIDEAEVLKKAGVVTKLSL